MTKNKKYKRLLILAPNIFFIAGVCVFIWGIGWLISALKFKTTAVEVPGVITRIDSAYDDDGDEHYSVFVSYEYKGERYEDVRINSYSSSMYEGKEISLYCDPDKPRHIQAKSMLYFPPIFLMAFGLIFALVGGGFTISVIINSHKRKRLMEQGISIFATVEEVVYNTSTSVNGRHPFIIYCAYRDEYKDVTYRFKSEDLWSDPSVVFPVGSTIEVRADANDYSKYYVNVEEMEKRVIDYT